MTMPSEDAPKQLELISYITDLLAREGVDHWLFGGWAVDFHSGDQVRPHRDVDFVVWNRDLERIGEALSAHGFIEASNQYPDEGVQWTGGRGELELVFIERTEEGEVVTPGRYRDMPWPKTSFDQPAQTYEGVTCPVVSVGALKHWKSVVARREARSYQAQDEEDLVRLRRLDV